MAREGARKSGRQNSDVCSHCILQTTRTRTLKSINIHMNNELTRRSFLEKSTLANAAILGLASAPKPLLALGENEIPDTTSKDEFYTKWPYSRPQDVLPYIFATAERGNVDSILQALDTFGNYYPNYRLGSEKGKLLEDTLASLPSKPKVCLEVGTFWGYSAMRTARHLADGAFIFILSKSYLLFALKLCW